MFERFTQQAREVVIHAQDEARDLDHPYIGTEHLLLALLNPDAGIAHTVLHAAGGHSPAVHGTDQEGARTVAARGGPPAPQLHRHRAPPARAAARGERARRHGARGGGARPRGAAAADARRARPGRLTPAVSSVPQTP